jgi:tryptophan-rich sensory protein
MKTQTKRNILIYSVSIAVPLAVGVISALLTMGNMDIYKELDTPPLSPPSVLFPIVWTVLYILMGISCATVWKYRKTDKNAEKALYYYAASLVFNFVWSILFFNLRLFLPAFIWLLMLLYLIIRTVVCYFKVYRPAAYLQIPYIVWVAFAGYLNLGIRILNG